MSSENGNPPPHLRTVSARADDLVTHGISDPALSVRPVGAKRGDCTDSPLAGPSARAEREARRAPSDPVSSGNDARTAASARAENAYRDWNAVTKSQRPLALARGEVASQFNARMHAHWVNGNDAMSNVVIAERYMGINEKTVRQWRDDEKAMPLAALLVLPPTIAAELLEWVQDRRSLTPHRRGLPMLGDALTRLERPVATDDREEVLRGLREARDQIIARLDRLASEGK